MPFRTKLYSIFIFPTIQMKKVYFRILENCLQFARVAKPVRELRPKGL